MPSVQGLIGTAIQQKLTVTAMYQGLSRIMCPHIIGYKGGPGNFVGSSPRSGERGSLCRRRRPEPVRAERQNRLFAAIADGVVYVGSDDWNVYAFGLAA